MAKTYIVKQGEHLSGIAADNSFDNFETIWNDPANAALKALRDPHVLFPGDQLFIPDRLVKNLAAPTTMVHIYLITVQPLFLRLNVHDLDNQPVKNTPCELKVESKDVAQKKTNDKGFVTPDEEIDPKAQKGALTLHVQKAPAKKGDPPPPEPKFKFDLKIGHLNPETKMSGQQARLNNLGYFAGYSFNDLEQLLWAAEEFECDRINLSQARVTTRPKLVAIKPEDQNGSEESGDPTRPTGIQDKKIQAELKKQHGS